MPPLQPELRLTVGSRFEEIELVEQVASALLAHLGFPEPARDGILVAIREAVANAVQHGNALEAEKPVEIECRVEAGELVVGVRDRGQGFDPDALPDPLAPQNLLKPRGRGILLMRSYMDRVDFWFPERSGTLVELRARVATEVKTG